VDLALRRTAAFIAALALAAAGWAECGGWQASPEARMACCSTSGACPMHGSTEPGPGAKRAVTQAQADSCCAASNTDGSMPSSWALSVSVTAAAGNGPPFAAMLPPATAAALDTWRTHVPLPVARVPKHVLISVFLL
jgi:hypothetical protein